MRIVIVGPGAIGCLVASYLVRADHDVVLLGRDANHALRITQSGILVEPETSADEPITLPVRATADAGELGQPDYVCICVKAYDTASAMEHVGVALTPHTSVVSIQNGLGNIEQIRNTFRGPLICGVTSHGSLTLGPGHIRHTGSGRTVLAALPPHAEPAAARFAEVLSVAGMEADTCNTPNSMLWGKLIVNAAINPVTALADVPNGEILQREELRKQAFAAAMEAEAVAQEFDIPLPYPHAAAEVERVCRATAGNLSSMLRDIRCGNQTEIEAITGSVVSYARARDVGAPVNTELLVRMRERERERRL